MVIVVGVGIDAFCKYNLFSCILRSFFCLLAVSPKVVVVFVWLLIIKVLYGMVVGLRIGANKNITSTIKQRTNINN